jgi:hypothetical protein
MDATIRLRAEDDASKVVKELQGEVNKLGQQLKNLGNGPKKLIPDSLAADIRKFNTGFREINNSLAGSLKDAVKHGRNVSDGWRIAENRLSKYLDSEKELTKSSAKTAAARVRDANAYRKVAADISADELKAKEKLRLAERKLADEKVHTQQFWRKFESDIFKTGLDNIEERVKAAAKAGRAEDRLRDQQFNSAKAVWKKQDAEKEASHKWWDNLMERGRRINRARAVEEEKDQERANQRFVAGVAKRFNALRQEHARLPKEMLGALGGAYNSGRHAIRSFSHPFFSSPLFAATAGAALVERGGHKAVELAEHLDRAETDARFRYLSRGYSVSAAESNARSDRNWAMDRGVALGAPSDHLLDGAAEAMAHGIPDAMSKPFAEMMFSTAKVFGEKMEHVAGQVGYALAQEFHGPWHGQPDAMEKAGNLVGTLERLSTSGIGTTPDRMMAFMQSGLGAGRSLGITNNNTILGLGAALTASGLSGSMASRMLQLSSEHLSDLAVEEKDKRRQHFSYERDRWLRVPRQLGYGSYSNLQATMKANPNEGFTNLIQSFGNIADINDRNYAIAQVLGPQYTRAINNLIDNPEILKKAMENARREDNGDLRKQLEKEYQKSLEYKLGQITESTHKFFYEIGDVLKDDIIGPLANFMAEWAKNAGSLKENFRAFTRGLIKGLGYDTFGELLEGLFGKPKDFDGSTIIWWRQLGTAFTEGIKAVFTAFKWAATILTPFKWVLELFVGKIDGKKIAFIAGAFLALTFALHALAPLAGIMGILAGTGGFLWQIGKFLFLANRFKTLSTMFGWVPKAAGGALAGSVEGGVLASLITDGALAVSIAAISAGAVAAFAGAVLTGLLYYYRGDGIVHGAKPKGQSNVQDDLPGVNTGPDGSTIQASPSSYNPPGSNGSGPGFFGRVGNRIARAFGLGGGSGGASGNGSRSWRNNNPGNIKFGAYARSMGATGADDKGFAVFPSYDVGRKAQESLLFNSEGYKHKTLAGAIARWAPGSDGNDPDSYAAELARAAGVDVNTRMENMTPEQRVAILDAMQKREGWQPGVAGGDTTAGPVRANLMNGQYGGVGQNLGQLVAANGKATRVNNAALPSFQGFIRELEAQGYNIKSLGGFSPRNIRGGSRLSQHAYGNAIDLNPGNNPLGTTITDMPENVRALAKKYGLIWGMDWKGRKDPMHFEWNGTRPWLEEQKKITTPTTLADSVGSRMGDSMMGATHNHHGDVHIHMQNPVSDPEANAKALNKTLQQSMNRRAHDVEFDYA